MLQNYCRWEAALARARVAGCYTGEVLVRVARGSVPHEFLLAKPPSSEVSLGPADHAFRRFESFPNPSAIAEPVKSAFHRWTTPKVAMASSGCDGFHHLRVVFPRPTSDTSRPFRRCLTKASTTTFLGASNSKQKKQNGQHSTLFELRERPD